MLVYFSTSYPREQLTSISLHTRECRHFLRVLRIHRHSSAETFGSVGQTATAREKLKVGDLLQYGKTLGPGYNSFVKEAVLENRFRLESGNKEAHWMLALSNFWSTANWQFRVRRLIHSCFVTAAADFYKLEFPADSW